MLRNDERKLSKSVGIEELSNENDKQERLILAKIKWFLLF